MPRKKNLPTRPEQQDYAAFLHGIKLIGLGLQECRATLNRDLYFETLERKRGLRTISTDYKLLEAHKEFFNVSADLTLSVDDKKNPATRALLIQCKYEAHFHCDECVVTSEFAKRFTESELRLVLWPYFRQFINDVSNRMAIAPILIPFSTSQSLR